MNQPRGAAGRRVAWLAWLLLVALALAQVVRTPVLTDITAFLPGPADADQRLLAAQLRDGVAARLLLVELELPPAVVDDRWGPELARLAGRLRERIADDPAFRWVADGSAGAFERDRQALFDARWHLLDEPLDVAALRLAFARLEDTLRSAAAPAVRPIAAEDPTLASLRLLERLGAGDAPRTRHGAWVAADGRRAMLIAETRAPGFDLDAQQQALARLQLHLRTALADGPADLPKPTLNAAGPGPFSVASRTAIEGDVTRLSIAATALIALLLWAVLRSVRVIGLAAIPVATGVVVALAAVGLGWGSIHGVTLGFGITLIGEAVDYAIYAWVQRRPDGGAAPQLWSGIALAVATSAAGFAAMFFSGFAGLAQLGAFSIVGIVAAGACARWLLPPLLPATPRPAPPRIVAAVDAAAQAAARLRVPLAVAALAAVLLLVSRGERLWNDDPAVLSSLPAATTERDGRVRDALGLPDLRLLVAVRGATADEALARAERLAPTLEAARAAGRLAGWDSPATLLPSAATQQARRDALPDADTLRARIAQALAGTNLRAEAFEPFVRSVAAARAGPPLTAAHYEGTGLGRRLAAQRVEDRDGAAVLVTVRGVADPAAFAAALRALPADHPAGRPVVLDLKDDVRHLIADYRQRALQVALGGVAVIVLLLAWRVRTPRAIAGVVAALGCGCLLAGAGLVLLYNSLTLFHLVALLLVAGVGSNYTMFCSTLPANPADRAAARLSVVLCAASTFIAFALLATSSAPVLRMIGSTVALGVIATLLCSFAFASSSTATAR